MSEVWIPAGGVSLPGRLTLPPSTNSVVLFAHGRGSGRESPRNRQVAEALRRAGVGTVLFDLLTKEETGEYRKHVFDINLLARRLEHATRWVRSFPDTSSLRLGYFGASTGAAAALIADAAGAHQVRAIVSRGGRPDLAGDVLEHVRAPTLLIVGGDDLVLEINQAAADRLRCTNRITVISGASHLFEEPGAMKEVVRLTVDWFSTYLLGE